MSKVKPPVELYELHALCRCRVDSAKAIKRDFDVLEADLEARIATLRTDLATLRRQYAEADQVIAEYGARAEETENRIASWGTVRKNARSTHVSTEQRRAKKVARLSKLREELARLEQEVGS